MKFKMPSFFAIPYFASNSISTVAYAAEQIFIALIIMGISAWTFSNMIALVISLFIAIITFSYITVIRLNPKGGSSYSIARENIDNPIFAVLSASAMLFDYVMTIAVSISAAVAAVYSVRSSLYDHSAVIAVIFILGLMFINLRGHKLQHSFLYIPVYVFIIGIFVLVVLSFSKSLTGIVWDTPNITNNTIKDLYNDLGIPFGGIKILAFVVFLKAFSNGFSALTGIETIVEKMDTLKKSSGAVKTLVVSSLLLILMLLGITWMASLLHVLPVANETMLSQITRKLTGRGYFWMIFQLCTVLTLIFAANSCFGDFPRLLAVLAKARFAPRQFKSLGDRLSYSNGVIAVALFSSVIVLIFNASVYRLIPLYAVGVFITFAVTLFSTALKLKQMKKKTGAVVLFTSAFFISLLAIVIIVSKFTQGAFLALAVIILQVLMFYSIHRHYVDLGRHLRLSEDEYVEPVPLKTTALILTSGIHKGIIPAISYSKSISNDARALYIDTDPEEARAIKENWEKYSMGVPLVVIESPYRSIIKPIMQYLSEAKRERPGYVINVIIPELVLRRTSYKLLHNKLALVLRVILSFQKDVIVTHVSYYIDDDKKN